jgi:raffinose/stachyose/melibiose transport system substrate-binding protein
MKKSLAVLVTILVVASLFTGFRAAASKSVKDPVTITYCTWDYADRTASTDAFVKEVKDKLNVTLEVQNIPTDQYQNIVKTKIASDDLPDLVHVHAINRDLTLYGQQIDPNLFADISGLKVIADYEPSVVKDMNRNGKLYYVPVSTNALGIIYNKKVFAKAGITKAPKNIKEFYAMCDRLKAIKIPPIAGSFKDAWTTQIIPFIGFSQYVDLKDGNMWTKLATGTKKYKDISADVLKTLDLTGDWIKKGYISKNYLATDANMAAQMVGLGKAGMIINGTWQYKAVQDSDPKAQIGFMALPLNAVGEKMAIATSSDEGIAVNAKSKNLDIAKQVLELYLSEQNQTLVIKDLKGVPLNKKVKVQDPFVNGVQTAMATAAVLPRWWGSTYFPSGTNIDLGKDLQDLVAGGISSKKLLQKFDDESAKAIANKKQ